MSARVQGKMEAWSEKWKREKRKRHSASEHVLTKASLLVKTIALVSIAFCLEWSFYHFTVCAICKNTYLLQGGTVEPPVYKRHTPGSSFCTSYKESPISRVPCFHFLISYFAMAKLKCTTKEGYSLLKHVYYRVEPLYKRQLCIKDIFTHMAGYTLSLFLGGPLLRRTCSCRQLCIKDKLSRIFIDGLACNVYIL